jgi:hypothetical protein
MTRARAEAEAASRNQDPAFTYGGLSYRAERSLAAETEWAVVTLRDGKPVQREY